MTNNKTTDTERRNTSPCDAATVDRIVGNARRLGHTALVAAVALDLMAPIAGRVWIPLCCSCCQRMDPADEWIVRRIAQSDRHDAGPCNACDYGGYDTLVASIPR